MGYQATDLNEAGSEGVRLLAQQLEEATTAPTAEPTLSGRKGIHVLAVMDTHRVSGPAKQLLALAANSPDQNVKFTIALFQRSREGSPFLLAARQADIPTMIIPDRFPGDPGSLLSLAGAIRACRPDILQTHGYKPNVLGRLLSPRLRIPWVAFLHGETWENRKVRIYFALERRAVRRADRIVAVSRCMADHAVRYGTPGSRVKVVHNACLTPPDTEGQVAAWREDTPPVVGYVSRLSPEKGVDVALMVHQLVLQQVSSAKLVIAGEGPLLTELRQRADRLGISHAVNWLGYQTDMRELYRKMAVLLVAYRNEGLPNAMLEAMAYGVPVVAVALGGVPEVIVNGVSGFLISSEDDIQGLSNRVVALLNDVALRRQIGWQGQQEVRGNFSLGVRVKALRAVYEELLG